MSVTERRKGATWEQKLSTLLRQHGWHAERAGGGHRQDHGDLLGIPGWYFDAKSCRTHDLSGWVNTAQQQAPDPGRWAVLIKRRGHPEPEDGYAVLTIGNLLLLMQEAGY